MFISSTTPLDDTEIYDSGPKLADRTDRIVGMVYASESGVVYIEQSFDQANWDVSKTISVSADDGLGFSEEITAPYLRIRFENNSGSNQDEFRLYAKSSSAGDS